MSQPMQGDPANNHAAWMRDIEGKPDCERCQDTGEINIGATSRMGDPVYVPCPECRDEAPHQEYHAGMKHEQISGYGRGE